MGKKNKKVKGIIYLRFNNLEEYKKFFNIRKERC